jgi:hypothetical protein
MRENVADAFSIYIRIWNTKPAKIILRRGRGNNEGDDPN